MNRITYVSASGYLQDSQKTTGAETDRFLEMIRHYGATDITVTPERVVLEADLLGGLL